MDPNQGFFPWPGALSQLRNKQKLPKIVYIILSFLVLQFGENFMKIPTKIAKLQMHETFFHSHFYTFFLSFHEWQLKQHLISKVFNQFKIEVHLFKSASSYPNFDDLNAFFPKFNRSLALTSIR